MTNLTIIQDGQAVTTSRQVAENFSKQHSHVMENIREILAVEKSTAKLFFESTYENRGKQYPEYIMNRDGFTLLAMGFTGSDAMQWKIKYIQAFNEMEKQLVSPKPLTQLEILAQSAQILLEQDKAIKQLSATQTKQAEELQGIRDVITLDTTSWRTDTAKLINRIADKSGGTEHIVNIRTEAYKLLDARMGVNVKQRLTNLRNRLMNEGMCKSKRDKTNQLDVIGDDKKLIEGFVAIVKDMAIKAGIA